MRTNRTCLLKVTMCVVLAMGVAYARTPPKSSSSSVHAKSSKAKHSKARKSARTVRKRGQQAMDAARVREIQAALIREKYLEGQPSGLWDQRSKQAMQHYQAANGWQTKMVPDSRALIKLGLGPDRAGLINPETAATTSFIPGGGSSPQR